MWEIGCRPASVLRRFWAGVKGMVQDKCCLCSGGADFLPQRVESTAISRYAKSQYCQAVAQGGAGSSRIANTFILQDEGGYDKRG